jgi:glucose-1-phosphate thymidylyltransferase
VPGEGRHRRHHDRHGGRKSGDFLSLLGNGKDFGLKHLNYTYQEGEGGIAEALGLAEHWAKGDDVVVVLGDNIIEKNIRKAVSEFREQKKGAKILLKEVPDPERFGVATLQARRSCASSRSRPTRSRTRP